MLTRSEMTEQFITLAFPNYVNDYKEQWRRRFLNNSEWAYSDLSSRRLLQKLWPHYYPLDAQADFNQAAAWRVEATFLDKPTMSFTTGGYSLVDAAHQATKALSDTYNQFQLTKIERTYK